MANWKTVKLGDIFHQYRNEIWIDDAQTYGQITISKKGTVSFRCRKTGKTIGRKRQFKINLQDNPNTMLFTRQGVTDGAIAFAPDEVDQCIATENMPMFSLDETRATKSFIQHLLLSTQFKSEIAKIVPTGSAQKSIHERELMQIPFKLPSLPEQKEIEIKLDQQSNYSKSLDAEITEQGALLKKLRQSILQDAIQGKLTADWRKAHPDTEPAANLLERIQAEKQKLIADKKIRKQKPLPPINPKEIPFDIPKDWEWCRIGNISYSIVPNRDKPKSFSGDIAWITMTQLVENKFTLADSSDKGLSFKEVQQYNCRIMPPGSVITGCVGRYGVAAVIDKDIVANQQLHCYVPYLSIPQYLVYTIVANAEYFENASIQTTLKYVNKTKCESLPISLPPLAEQTEIVERVEKLFGMVGELEQQVTRSRTDATALMASVLAAAFASS